MAKKVFDVVATVGKYTSKDGTEKKRYLNVGAAFEDDQGKLSIKLEAIPVGTEWSGWLSLYTPKEREQSPAPTPAPTIGYTPGSTKDGGFQDMDSDIPFLFNMNTVCDILGKPTSLWRAKYGKEMLLLRANQADC